MEQEVIITFGNERIAEIFMQFLDCWGEQSFDDWQHEHLDEADRIYNWKYNFKTKQIIAGETNE